jgi:protein transport protein SEC23
VRHQRADPPAASRPAPARPRARARPPSRPRSRVDFRAKIWICPFCFQRNHFPPHYAELSEQNLPAELIPNYTTIEYTLSRPRAPPPVFLWLVDTCMVEEELHAVRDSLEQALSLLPEDALVGLITFGTTVQVHEIGYEHCAKSYVFRATKEPSAQQLSDLLGLRAAAAANRAGGGAGGAPGARTGASRFLLPVSECEYALSTILAELQKDPWPTEQAERPLRCTGVAVSVAEALLEATYPNAGARVQPSSEGPARSGRARSSRARWRSRSARTTTWRRRTRRPSTSRRRSSTTPPSRSAWLPLATSLTSLRARSTSAASWRCARSRR